MKKGTRERVETASLWGGIYFGLGLFGALAGTWVGYMIGAGRITLTQAAGLGSFPTAVMAFLVFRWNRAEAQAVRQREATIVRRRIMLHLAFIAEGLTLVGSTALDLDGLRRRVEAVDKLMDRAGVLEGSDAEAAAMLAATIVALQFHIGPPTQIPGGFHRTLRASVVNVYNIFQATDDITPPLLKEF